MGKKINRNLLVQKYLGNEFNAIELSEFEHLIKKDRQLATELKLQLSVDQAISDPRLENFKTYLENLHNKHLGGKFKSRSLGYNRYIALVASLIVIVTLGSVLVYDKYNQSPGSQYFEEFYKPFDITIVKRNQDSFSIMHEDVIKFVQLYNSRDFEYASQFLPTLDTDSYSNQQFIMMTGIVHLELSNFKLANDAFNKVLSGNDEFLKNEAFWYLGLAYLKANEINHAKICMNKIVKENSFYSKKASELLKKLK